MKDRTKKKKNKKKKEDEAQFLSIPKRGRLRDGKAKQETHRSEMIVEDTLTLSRATESQSAFFVS